MSSEAELRRALRQLLKVAEALLPLADDDSPLWRAVIRAREVLDR
jgi:hypothetical protein